MDKLLSLRDRWWLRYGFFLGLIMTALEWKSKCFICMFTPSDICLITLVHHICSALLEIDGWKQQRSLLISLKHAHHRIPVFRKTVQIISNTKVSTTNTIVTAQWYHIYESAVGTDGDSVILLVEIQNLFLKLIDDGIHPPEVNRAWKCRSIQSTGCQGKTCHLGSRKKIEDPRVDFKGEELHVCAPVTSNKKKSLWKWKQCHWSLTCMESFHFFFASLRFFLVFLYKTSCAGYLLETSEDLR